MKFEYQHFDTPARNYQGLSFDESECRMHLRGPVKDNLLDSEERQDYLAILKTLSTDTGFEANEQLLADIQVLEEDNVYVQNFRIGEAYAEVVLEEQFHCRFYWNENRDTRNPKGNKHGADLVGFIEINEQVLFLFGEVKTSSETNRRPPQVMTNSDGIENQLRDLNNNPEKRRILIGYLKNKARLLYDGHPFKNDLNAGIKTYYSGDNNYNLIGVLIRDVEPDERDVAGSYATLKEQVLEPISLKLLALYLPIPQFEWLSIINEERE